MLRKRGNDKQMERTRGEKRHLNKSNTVTANKIDGEGKGVLVQECVTSAVRDAASGQRANGQVSEVNGHSDVHVEENGPQAVSVARQRTESVTTKSRNDNVSEMRTPNAEARTRQLSYVDRTGNTKTITETGNVSLSEKARTLKDDLVPTDNYDKSVAPKAGRTGAGTSELTSTERWQGQVRDITSLGTEGDSRMEPDAEEPVEIVHGEVSTSTLYAEDVQQVVALKADNADQTVAKFELQKRRQETAEMRRDMRRVQEAKEIKERFEKRVEHRLAVLHREVEEKHEATSKAARPYQEKAAELGNKLLRLEQRVEEASGALQFARRTMTPAMVERRTDELHRHEADYSAALKAWKQAKQAADLRTAKVDKFANVDWELEKSKVQETLLGNKRFKHQEGMLRRACTREVNEGATDSAVKITESENARDEGEGYTRERGEIKEEFVKVMDETAGAQSDASTTKNPLSYEQPLPEDASSTNIIHSASLASYGHTELHADTAVPAFGDNLAPQSTHEDLKTGASIGQSTGTAEEASLEWTEADEAELMSARTDTAGFDFLNIPDVQVADETEKARLIEVSLSTAEMLRTREDDIDAADKRDEDVEVATDLEAAISESKRTNDHSPNAQNYEQR